MTEILHHRGPDGGDTYCDQNVALGHRRLSILDLSVSGNQPFFSRCGNFVLAFNGEIFNFKTFYPELKAKGYEFHSTSDTEVLLYLLMEYGISVLSRLNGFFAFSLWNKKEKKILIGRDRFGVKPLFYAENGEEFLFASEPKAIFGVGYPKKIKEENIAELFFFRYISGENTIFEGVYRLLPGHYLEMDQFASQIKKIRWFHLGEESQKLNIKNPIEWFESKFLESIRYRMISDVPVGTLLSGGLDSSSVLYGQYAGNYFPISAWNISFSNYQHDESAQARRLAESYGMQFNTFEFVKDELFDLVSKAIFHNDEPITHLQDGHLLGISKEAKKKVSVLLSGEGADEVLGGYVRYKVHDKPWRYQILQYLRYVPNRYLTAPRLKKMKRYLEIPNVDLQLMSNSNELFLSDLKELGLQDSQILIPYRMQVLEEAKEYYPKNRFRQLLYLEQHTHLCTLNDRNDRTTMGASIECRDPFLDPELVTGVASLPDNYFSSQGKGKLLLRSTIGRHLPDYILNHPKIGLSVPWDVYFTTHPHFKDRLETLHLSPIFQLDFFCRMDIKGAIEEFKKDTSINYGLVRQLFFLALWYEINFMGR
jgi:asparagine synthase (glutamine-hydrolysing)